uniref:PLAT domain-containing protein n=1 Tax=Serinus canaria TaxID=9135 RepID=A0A8C9MHL5_SERCA
MPERASDEGSFLVTLYTGSRWNAGTTAEVFLQLIGQYGRSKFRCLWHQPSPAFQRGSIDCFLITTKKKLGDISSFKIRLNNDGKSPTWFLSRAEVEDMSTRKSVHHLCTDLLIKSVFFLLQKSLHQKRCKKPQNSQQIGKTGDLD